MFLISLTILYAKIGYSILILSFSNIILHNILYIYIYNYVQLFDQTFDQKEKKELNFILL